jgi:excinuclease ABC subunit C
VLELDCSLEFDPQRDDEFFASLPARPAVYLIRLKQAGQPYLSRTIDLRRAAERLLRLPSEPTKRLNLRDLAASLQFRITASKFEQLLCIYQQARIEFPGRYKDFLRLRRPALVKLNLRNAYPRCYATRRISADEGLYIGPFASRHSAEFYAERFRDLFKLRRCQIKIRRDPEYPGCIYSEMKMCYAPCFGGCSVEDYYLEVDRATAALASQGDSLLQALEREREAASEALDFEAAAAAHRKLEKASSSLRGFPQLVRRIDQLDAVILQRAATENSINFFEVRRGVIQDPFTLHFGDASNPKSAEEMIRERLEPAAFQPAAARTEDSPQSATDPAAAEHAVTSLPIIQAAAPDATAESLREKYGFSTMSSELPDHLSLLARWFYGKPRDGEIFFREKVWPYRRLLRACARILAPPSATPETPDAAPPDPTPSAPPPAPSQGSLPL